MNIELYPHNQETYEKIMETWETKNRVATVQATGTGKSMLILKCLYAYPKVKKVVLAPSHHILNQLAGKVDALPNTSLMTYSKLALMTEEEIQELNVDMIVLDEFHRCGAESWGSGVGKLIDTYSDAKILGTTATPIRYLDGERDMTDELFDGNVVTNLSLPHAIVKGILPMPRYVSALYTFEDEILNLNEKIIKSSNSDEDKEDMRKEVEQMKKKLDKSKGIPVILKKHLGKASGKFIVFCRNTEHLFEVKNTVAEWFIKGKVNSKVTSYEVYTGSDKKDDHIIEQFRNVKVDGSIHLLFSINKLNEGLHVDDIDGVIFLRSTVSPIIYYQQLGRALKAGGNTPTVFDFVNNFNGIKSNKFVQELYETFESENAGRASNNQEQLNIEDFTIYDEMQDAMELFGGIEGQLKDNWDDIFKRYCNGEESDQLERWKNKQRVLQKNKSLDRDRFVLLDQTGFVWEPLDLNWIKYYSALEKYYCTYGHTDVPPPFVTGDIKLGEWVIRQRRRYNIGKLTKERIEKLKKLKFLWAARDEKWEINIMLLKNNASFSENPTFKNWCANTRQRYKKGILSQEKIDQLNALSFEWEPIRGRSKTKQLQSV
ncbi:Helicase associated domain protein [Paenibacillus sp. QZ-Y1]|uniref:Helicase associated domain protein n=1 Tax=Paenibacillus sp. QZ-Y1 TaxID=3414511 RepID=UPI003F797E83